MIPKLFFRGFHKSIFILLFFLCCSIPAIGKPGIQLKISSPKYFRPGDKGKVFVHIQNPTKQIFLLKSLVLESPIPTSRILYQNSFYTTINGDLIQTKEGKQIISGIRIWTENVPPYVARKILEKREILGKEIWPVYRVLYPKKALLVPIEFTVPADRQSFYLQGVLKYKILPSQTTVYEKSSNRSTLDQKQPAKPKTSSDGRWVVSFESYTSYRSTQKPLQKRILLSRTRDGKIPLLTVKAIRESVIFPLSFTLVHALQKAGIQKADDYFYYVPLDKWVLIKNNQTYFVNCHGVWEYPGNHLSLVRRLQEVKEKGVTLFSHIDEKKLQKVLAFWKKEGFLIKVYREKSGLKSGVLLLRALEVEKYLKKKEEWKKILKQEGQKKNGK
ncbi:MAG: hypothetical protein D6785_16485 [Planctomycetota bacterium]|nr:MAG: hypothetical protein D6785_16485 [Planctomycetota bacterium]